MTQQRLANGRFAVGNTLVNISRVGRKLNWETPEDLLKDFEDYIEYSENNPLIAYEFNGKDAIECEVKKKRALTIFGFAAFCGTYPDAIYVYQKNPVFTETVKGIRAYFSNDLLTGAMAGLLNAGIVSKLEGLVERKEVDVNSNQKVVLVMPKTDTEGRPMLESPSDPNLIEDAEWE